MSHSNENYEISKIILNNPSNYSQIMLLKFMWDPHDINIK